MILTEDKNYTMSLEVEDRESATGLIGKNSNGIFSKRITPCSDYLRDSGTEDDNRIFFQEEAGTDLQAVSGRDCP